MKKSLLLTAEPAGVATVFRPDAVRVGTLVEMSVVVEEAMNE